MSESLTKIDITTPEGMDAAMKIIRKEELNRFLDLQRQFIQQVKDDVLREQLEAAHGRMELINAE